MKSFILFLSVILKRWGEGTGKAPDGEMMLHKKTSETILRFILIFIPGRLQSDIFAGSSKYHETLDAWLSPFLATQARWSRCYSAAVDGWSSLTFHEQCDLKGPTLTLVKVHSYVFGGFLDQNWGGNYV